MERPPDSTLSSPLVARSLRVGIVAWAGVGLAVLLYILYRYRVHPIRVIFPPLLVALVLVYLLNPIVTFLERRGLRRGWGTLVTYVVFLSAVGVGLSYLIPVIIRQADGFTETVPDLLDRAKTGLVDLADRFGFDIREDNLFSTFTPGEGGSAKFIQQVLSIGAGVLHVAVIMILGPVLAFYLLVDLPKLRQGLEATIPIRRRPEVRSLLEKLGTAIGGYFRGQLLVALFVGIASMTGLYVVGLPYWAPVGLICGLFNLVPLIGPFIGAIPALFIAFTTPEAGPGFLLHPRPGWPLALAASAALLVVQQIDNHVISPNVVARTVRLHPLTVMLSLLAAGTVFGLWGMLLVIPIVASVKILLMHYWDTRMMWPPPDAGGAPAPPGRKLEERPPPDAAVPAERGERTAAGAVSESPTREPAVTTGGPAVPVDTAELAPGGPAVPVAAGDGGLDTAPEGQTGGWWFKLKFWGRGNGSRRERTRASRDRG